MSFSNPLVKSLSEAFNAPWPGPRGESVTLKDDDLTVTVCPEDGARITSLKFGATEFLRTYNPDRRAFQYGCFPMVPFVGRIRGGDIKIGGRNYHLYQNKGENAMHGMAMFDPWKVVEQTAKKVVLTNEIGEPYPFPCKVTQTIELEGNTLKLALSISSSHAELPVDAGWHPWWLKKLSDTDEEMKLTFNADAIEETGSDELPTLRRLKPHDGPWDDCFDFDNSNAAAVMKWGDRHTVTMISNCPALVVFDKQPDATCVNPMSGIPNGVNTDPHLITPVTELVARSSWKFS